MDTIDREMKAIRQWVEHSILLPIACGIDTWEPWRRFVWAKKVIEHMLVTRMTREEQRAYYIRQPEEAKDELLKALGVR